jgi:hypothetical protein
MTKVAPSEPPGSVTSGSVTTGAAEAAHPEREKVLARELLALSATEQQLSRLRGVAMLGALVALGLAWSRALTWLYGVAGVVFAFFVVLVVRHARLVARELDAKARLEFTRRGLAVMSDAALPRALPTGEGLVDDGHACAHDLDVVGPNGLLSRIATPITARGQRALADLLLGPRPTAAVVRERQAAVRELTGERALREDLAALSATLRGHKLDEARLARWASHASPLASASTRWLLAARLLAPLTLGLVLAPRLVTVPAPFDRAWLVSLAIQGVLMGLLWPRLAPVFEIASEGEAEVARFAPLFARLEESKLEAPPLARAVDALRGEGEARRASVAVARLARIVSFVDLRRSTLIHVLVNVWLLWDAWWGASLDGWRREHGERIPGWLAAVGELEAFAALATFADETPGATYPEVTDGPPRLEAEGLAHPLLPRKTRVANDVSLVPAREGEGRALLITGSNMGGKSTLLRAVGLNVVLALAGAPVVAKRLTVHTAAVWTSMRVRDSLASGVSHFYAEIKRLKAVLDAAERGEPVLFLLDEVLHGTNSRERVQGAKAVTRRLLELGAVGALTSHDLGLAPLEEETGGQVECWHLREQVSGETMSFDYVLRRGVVTTTNALRLMKGLGLPVEG